MDEADRERLREELRRAEERLAALRAQRPAHSASVAMEREIEDLEEEVARLRRLLGTAGGPASS